MTAEQLKTITDGRLKSAIILMDAEDWFFAGYAMAMALECALKAVICKTLNISTYPEDPRQNQRIVSFFRTHEFEQLRVLAGMEATFSPIGLLEAVQNWSDFTKEFTGNWVEVRYDHERQQQFNRAKVERLFTNLTHDSYGIITIIKRKW